MSFSDRLYLKKINVCVSYLDFDGFSSFVIIIIIINIFIYNGEYLQFLDPLMQCFQQTHTPLSTFLYSCEIIFLFTS